MTRQHKNLLLVEDDKDDQEFFAEAIAEADPSCTWRIAGNAVEAFALLRKQAPKTPDYILLDINLPLMSGLEFLRLIKQMDNYKSIPVVVLTTSTTDYKKCYQLGACLYLIKPTSSNVYREMLQDLLKRKGSKEYCEILSQKYSQLYHQELKR